MRGGWCCDGRIGEGVVGRLNKTLDESYLLPPTPALGAPIGRHSEAFVEQLLAYDYEFPPGLTIERRVTNLTEMIEEFRKSFGGKP